jgi:hypothetical protein
MLVPSGCPTLVCRGLRPVNVAFAFLIFIPVFYPDKNEYKDLEGRATLKERILHTFVIKKDKIMEIVENKT